VSRASATTIVPGRIAHAEELWYDPHRWAAWIDGFGHVAKLDDEWPHEGSRLLWDSPPQGRGRVSERVVAYEPRVGQTVHVENEKLLGAQQVAFAAVGDDVRITLTLEYDLKQGGPLAPLLDSLYIRRAQEQSLRRTLVRFGYELRAAMEP
jgi:hypothetical protein